MKARTLRMAVIGLTAALTAVTGAAAGLTPVQSWSPTGAVAFKTASVAHFPGSTGTLDYYGIFAVFTVRALTGPLVDELWYLRVDGLSTYSAYGRLVSTRLVARETVISSVDSCSDGNRTAFVAWDRSDDPFDTADARWARVDVYGSISGPYTIPSCCSGASFGVGIAYHDGAVAVSGGGRGRCSYCSWVWTDAFSPGVPVQRSYWITEQTPYASDIEWNGSDYFIMAHLIYNDGSGRPFVAVTRVTAEGAYGGSFEMLEEPSWDASDYRKIYLVHTDNASNPGNLMFIQTDRRAFWIDRWGWTYDPPVASTPRSLYPACEYWGAEDRAAQTYHSYSIGTYHREWLCDAAPSVNNYYLSDIYLGPVACGSSDSYVDAEVLLVRKRVWTAAGVEQLFFNFEPQD